MYSPVKIIYKDTGTRISLNTRPWEASCPFKDHPIYLKQNINDPINICEASVFQ